MKVNRKMIALVSALVLGTGMAGLSQAGVTPEGTNWMQQADLYAKYGCPLGYVCIYNYSQLAAHHPGHVFYHTATYNFSGSNGTYKGLYVVVNNQRPYNTSAVAGHLPESISLCTGWNGTGICSDIQRQTSKEVNMTPINSMVVRF